MSSASLRSHVSDFKIRLGTAQTYGRLVAVKKPSNKPDYKLCTPDGKPVKQVYRDTDNNVWEKEDLGRALEVDGGLEQVDVAAIDEAKTSDLPVNIMELSIHPTEEVDKYLFPSEHNCYVFEPIVKKRKVVLPEDPKNIQWFNFIYTILEEGSYSLVGKCNLKNSEALFRVQLYQGNILIVRQNYPDGVNEFEPRAVEVNDAFKTKALAVASNNVKPFNPAEYTDDITAKLSAIEPGVEAQPVAKTEETGDFDIMSALDDFEI